jgi:gamma-glutamyl hydrolase
MLISHLAPVLVVLAAARNAAAGDTVVNTRPIIGILTQPTSHESMSTATAQSYIAASYVKFVEASGARAVPVFHNGSEAYLRDTFNSINGLLLPGGGANISTGSVLNSAGRVLYDLALAATDAGDPFPIWGTCMGFQFLTILTAQNDSVLCSDCFNTEGLSLPLNFTSVAASSQLFGGLAKNNPELFAATAVEGLTANTHHDGVFPSTYAANQRLADFYDILSTNTDPVNGREFASSIEAKTYPVLATQWHPEKNNFEWLGGNTVNHSAQAVGLSQYVGDTFIALARRSNHSFPNAAAEQGALIYNYSPIKDPSGYFEQIYVWDSC